MFSHITGQMPIARRMALLSTFCLLTGHLQAQELNAPLQAPGPLRAPGAFQTPGAIQSPGTFRSPGGFQNSGPQSDVDAIPAATSGLQSGPDSVVFRVQAASERMEMTVNSSRIVTLGQNIPRAQVNNKEVLELSALSPTEIQVFAKKAGVTQINLWNEKGQIYTIDCIVYGDARELAELLKTEFPAANLHVRPMASSVLLTGFVDRADQVNQIIQIASDYYPKVVPNIRVGGVQQILLHVKVAEVSRTRLRALGFDFAAINGNSFAVSSISDLISAGSVAGGVTAPIGFADTVRFGAVDGNSAFFGFLEALRRDQLLKILSDPVLTTVSGRPAFFNSGGEFPILVPQSLGTVSIEYKKFGTQLDFVPIVLGNGNIRLEVRPRISEIDPTRSVTFSGTTIPGLRVREADTGVEMKPGQTLAIAGLVQTRVQGHIRRIPWLGDMAYIGAAFRRTSQEEEEIESIILVTPEVVEALDPCETPQCFPGMHSDVPGDCDLYWRGYMEVPSKGPCGPGGCYPGNGGPEFGSERMVPGGAPGMYEDISPGTPTPVKPAETRMPPRGETTMRGGFSTARNTAVSPAANSPRGIGPGNTNSRYSPSRGQDPRPSSGPNQPGGAPGFIGPVGYDVLN